MEFTHESQAMQTENTPTSKPLKRKLFTNHWLRLLMIPGVVTVFCAYANFFGYTYLKGKLNAAGFSANYIDLNINEAIYNATLGALHVFSLIAEYFSEYALWLFGMIFAATIITTIFVHGSKKIHVINIINKHFFSNIADFMMWLISGYVIFIAMIALLLLMIFGYALGQHHMTKVIEGDICKPLQNSDFSNKLMVRSCTQTPLADGKYLSGRTIFEDESYRYFLTNQGAYQINAQQEIVAANCFYKKTEPLNLPPIKSICSAICEPFCQAPLATPSTTTSRVEAQSQR